MVLPPSAARFFPLTGRWILIPVINFQIMGCRLTFACFHILTKAQQECRPLHTTVSHGLNGLAPVSVAEENNRLVVLLRQLEGDVSSNPFSRPLYAAPSHIFIFAQLLHFHHRSAQELACLRSKAEFDLSSDLAIT